MRQDKKTECSKSQQGKDEMNLAEYPIALLSKRNDTGKKTIEFSDEIIGENGKIIKREWIVTGSDKFGLPLAGDNDVLMALMGVGKEQDFKDPQINFSRYRLIQTMNWEDKGQSYNRIEQTLDRFKGVSIKAKNAFWDNDRKGYVTMNFGIIDSYELFDSARKSKGQDSLPFSYVVLNHILYKSIKAGYIKSVNLKTYFELEGAITKRLYRYLDKKRYDGKRKVEINIHNLGELHLGLSKTKYASQIKEKLEKAHEELIRKEFLKSVEYRKTSDGASEKVIYIFRGEERSSIAEPIKKDLTKSETVIEKLLRIGVTRQVAEQLAREYPEDIIEMQIKALPHRKTEDPAAVLITSIKDNWSLPAKLNEQVRIKAEKEAKKKQKEKEETEKANCEERIKNYIAELSEDVQRELTEEAKELAKKEGGKYFKAGELPNYMINGYLNLIVRKRLGFEEDVENIICGKV